MQVIRQRYWVNPPESNLGWRGINSYCVTESGDNTGYQGWNNLEEYDLDTNTATGNTKPNVDTDPDYIAPIQDENACPVPEPVYAWRGINLACVQEDGENTGYEKYQDLEEYDVDTNVATGNTKPNVSFDSDYIPPTYNETTCPIPEPTYIWEGYQPYCITREEPDPKPLDQDTQIAIIFDNSGSMGGVYDILDNMVDTDLWYRLQDRYSSFEQYKQKVKVYSSTDERFIRLINDRINEGTSDLITLTFSNEAASIYHENTVSSSDPLTPEYSYDIDRYYELKDQYTYNLNSVIFQVNLSGNPVFKNFLTYIENGLGSYAGAKGFKNNEEVKIKYDVKNGTQEGASEGYYANIIVQELNALGFDI